MSWAVVGLFLAGLGFSAFFSGSETGFYRASRVRLALDARAGDWVARGLVWLANNPAWFVATTLIGNNLANYVTSRSIVMGSEAIFPHGGVLVDLGVTLLLTPVIFLYGELVPKYVFFHAPNRLLHAAGPLFLLCVVLFAPVAWLLWIVNRVIQFLLGEAPARTQLILARNELQRVMEEGHAVGILYRAQRQLINGMFAVANQPLIRYSIPLTRLPLVRRQARPVEMLRAAQRYRAPAVLVSGGEREPVGYFRVADIWVARNADELKILPMPAINFRETPISALNRLQNEDHQLARVVDDHGRTLGILSDQALVEQLLARTV